MRSELARVRARLVPAAAAALIGALGSTILLALFYARSPALSIDFAVDPPARLVRGVYPAERVEASGLTFAWTGADVALRLPGLDRRVAWTVDLRVRGAREDAAANPAIVFFVDGVRAAVHQSQPDFTDVAVAIPPRSERPRGAVLTFQVSKTFVPGATDPRALGVMLDHVTVRPEGFALPPTAAFAAAARSIATLGAGVALLGVTPGSAMGAAILLAAGEAAVLARGFAPFSDYPAMVVRLAGAIALGMVVAALLLEWGRGAPLRNTARFAVVFSAAALFLRLLVFLHPSMPIGDALFQAHRFQEVLRGHYYFTSIAPGNYLFPYAPGLYVIASPFASLVRREMGDVMLLRIVVATTDALAGAALYPVVARVWDSRRTAAFAVALYLLLPLDVMIAAGGTLTSAFAQTVAVFGLILMAAPWVRLERLAAVALLALTLLAAFLSHTSTFALLAATTLAVAAVFAWRGGAAMRSPAAAVALAGAIAVVLAVALYYAHFLDTYRTEFTRISGETATAAADAGGRSIADRAHAVPSYMREYFGIPALALAALGAYELRRQAGNRLTLAILGLTLACLLFLAIGVLTPVDMRYYLAALPAVALAAAAGASSGWDTGGLRRAAIVFLLAWTAWNGLQAWWGTLR